MTHPMKPGAAHAASIAVAAVAADLIMQGSTSDEELADCIVRAYLAALAERGFKVVPREAPLDMRNAFNVAHHEAFKVADQTSVLRNPTLLGLRAAWDACEPFPPAEEG